MFLKSLRIIVGTKVIRQVLFKKGLNLIVDQTPGTSKEGQTSGNNVGKTTVLRCVDFCLGGKTGPLYIDPEFKTPNSVVLSFLESNNPNFVLELEDTSGRVSVVGRRFADKGGTIDGEELSEDDFERELKLLLFRLSSTHPTLRQLLPKFVRVEPTAKNNILRWLHHYGKGEDYESVWLTIFGANNPKLIKLRRDTQRLLSRVSKQLTTLRQVSRSPRQELPIVLRQLNEANQRLQDLSLEGAYDTPLATLASLRSQIVSHNQSIADLEAALGNVKQTLEIFSEDLPPMDARELKELYEDAEAFIPDLHVAYEKLVEFHAALLKNKTKFVKQNATDLNRRIRESRKALDGLLSEEASALRQFADPSVFADVRQLSDEIARLSQRKGELESLEKTMDGLRGQVDEQKAILAKTEKDMKEEEEQLERNLELLNTYFTDYTLRLYSEHLLIAMEQPKPDKPIAFTVVNFEGNEGSGKKKGQIAAFDLAYLRYRQEKEARTIRFTLQDEVELIDAKQLKVLFEIAQSIDGQYVIPVLKDRLASVDFPDAESCVVLRLSQESRFFGLS